MEGELQRRISTTISEETERKLQRYCSAYHIKRAALLRRLVHMVLDGTIHYATAPGVLPGQYDKE